MNNFSINSCYAVLSAFPQAAPVDAMLKMVVALVDEKKYCELDPQIMSKDFYVKFGFDLPYHPMQTFIQMGIDKAYFEYNSLLKRARPIWSAIDSGEFMKTLEQKDLEYDRLLDSFDQYLQGKYNLHSSKEELSEQVQAFIQRYGLISKVDKAILSNVKNDYHFAEFILDCHENGNLSVVNYIDAYTTGCAFAEVMTFSAPTNEYKNCPANVFLDTGFIFALLGIGSKDRSENFQMLFSDMIHLGMKPVVFQHTYSEIAGIIDTARNWIGNNNYDPSLASETAYFFVTNGWSYQKASELLGDLKRILTEDYKIRIDATPYPHVADIHTKYEADIKQMIIDEYCFNNGKFSPKDKDYTINQDAHSLFMTLHFNNGYIAHTLPDVKNIFITTNKTLTRVGKKLTLELIHGTGSYIPITLTDLIWGTLIWANSPAKISPLNKANIISAAYAAFQPSDDILGKLNQTLIKCQTNGELSPEKCYFLKTNTVALRLLSQKTQNDERRYSEQTPFEILKEIQDQGYQKGIIEKQVEVDRLFAEKEQANVDLAMQKQCALIKELEAARDKKLIFISGEKQHSIDVKEHLISIEDLKEKAQGAIASKSNRFKHLSVIVLLSYIGAIIYFTVRQETFGWLISLGGTIFPVAAWGISFILNKELAPQNIMNYYRKQLSPKIYLKYNYSQEKCERMQTEYARILENIASAEKDLADINKKLKKETAKIDQFSIDISLVTTS